MSKATQSRSFLSPTRPSGASAALSVTTGYSRKRFVSSRPTAPRCWCASPLYMDPWGATEPMNWWTIVNRCRALENTAFVVAANQGASLRHYPPYSWPGGSQIVDFDGRLLAEASPGPGERIVVAPIDISALRHERSTRTGHQMLAHLRTEAYPVYLGHRYPPRRRKCSASGGLLPAIAGTLYEQSTRNPAALRRSLHGEGAARASARILIAISGPSQ